MSRADWWRRGPYFRGARAPRSPQKTHEGTVCDSRTSRCFLEFIRARQSIIATGLAGEGPGIKAKRVPTRTRGAWRQECSVAFVAEHGRRRHLRTPELSEWERS